MGGRGANSMKKASGQRPFTNDEKEAIEAYVSGEMMYINQVLRGNGDISAADLYDSEKQFIKDLDRVTNRELGEMTLYRSVDASAIFGNISEGQYDAMVAVLGYGDKQKYILNKMGNIVERTKGKTITEKGFMSTTTDYSIARDWYGFTGSSKPVVMKIKTNKKTKGANVSYTDKKASTPQKERLLARNQKMQVTNISGKDGNIFVEVKLIE